MRLKLKKSIKITLLICLVLLLTGGFYFTFFPSHKSNDIKSDVSKIKKEEIKEPKKTEKERLEEQYQSNKEINQAYFGRIAFESGLVDFPIVASKDNKDYLNTGFDGKPDRKGAVFLDYRNTSDDQNLIVYGHYVYTDETKMFSPLHKLKKEENYKENSIFFLELEKEIRIYQVAYVYYYDIGNKVLTYWKTDFQKTFYTYFEAVNKVAMYDTSVDVKSNNYFMTLQTCVRNRDDLRLIIIGKEIKRQEY